VFVCVCVCVCEREREHYFSLLCVQVLPHRPHMVLLGVPGPEDCFPQQGRDPDDGVVVLKGADGVKRC
jgi:hypothetical protein